MKYKISEIREIAQGLLDLCNYGESELLSNIEINREIDKIFENIVSSYHDLVIMPIGFEGEEAKSILFKSKGGVLKKIKFVKNKGLCSKCALNTDMRSICLKCLSYEREDELDGNYVHAESAKKLAKKHLGKEIRYKGHMGMIVGYCKDEIILSFEDGYGWDNIEANKYNKILLQSELNKGFMYVDKNIL